MTRPARVLVVDSYPDVAASAAQVLALHGHDARPALSSAEAATAVAGGFIPDALVFDVWLTDGDGLDLAANLCRELPVRPLLVALVCVEGEARRCRAAGVDYLLLKPAGPGELVRLLDGHRAGEAGRGRT